MNKKWTTCFELCSSDPGVDYYKNQIISPKGKEITISYQRVITGKIEQVPIGDGCFRTVVVKKYDNKKPVVCPVCESMILKLNS